MDEEDSSRQEEARKVLESIRQQGDAEEKKPIQPEKAFSRLPSEDAAELENLISNTILAKSALPPPEEIPEEIVEVPEINPISTDQIKVMRKFATEKPHNKEPLLKIVCEFIIKSYFETVAYFDPAARARRCQQKGHMCIICGAIISPTGVIQENKDEPDPSAPKRRP